MKKHHPLVSAIFGGVCGLAVASSALAQSPSQSADPKMKAAVDDLYAANRILAFEGIITGAGHVSMRSPLNPQHLLISRSLAAPLVTAADIVELDINTCQNVVPGGPLLFQERYIHCGVYKAKPEAGGVVHSHTPNIIVFSVSTVPLRSMSNGGRIAGDGVPVHDMTTVKTKTGNLIASIEAGDSVAAKMGKGNVVLLRGHGSVVAAKDVRAVIGAVSGLEENAELELKALALGGKITWSQPSDFYQTPEITRELAGEQRGWNAEKAALLKEGK